MPLESWVYDASRWDFDIVFAQTTSLLLEFGVWLRKMRGIPLLCVNTTHLAAAYDVLLPERIAKLGWVNTGVELALKRPYEKLFSSIYNNSDGLVVLSEGLRSYWRERGVTAPIHVIPRAVQPEIFDKPMGSDPYAHLENASDSVWRGSRLLCAGRHTREKAQDRIIRIFARHVAPVDREATLTMLGEGPDTRALQAHREGRGRRSSRLLPGRGALHADARLLRLRRRVRARLAQRDLRQRPRRGALVRNADGRLRRRHGRQRADQGSRERRPPLARQRRRIPRTTRTPRSAARFSTSSPTRRSARASARARRRSPGSATRRSPCSAASPTRSSMRRSTPRRAASVPPSRGRASSAG